MPLSAAERHLVYEVLGVPDASSVLNVNADYGTGAKFQNFAVLTAKTEIDAILDVIDADDTLSARLSELLADWKKVSISATRLHPVATNQGVDRNPAKIRRLIRERVKKIVPVRVETIDDAGGALPIG